MSSGFVQELRLSQAPALADDPCVLRPITAQPGASCRVQLAKP
jgi:hypothetical protein